MNERLKKLRKALNFTQQEFAIRIGTTQNVVANYETGRRNPSRSVINNICKTFHVNEDWLRDGIGEMFAEVSKFEQIQFFVDFTLINKPRSFQMRFLAMLASLDESDWEVLERMALALIEKRTSNAPAPAQTSASEPERPAKAKPPVWQAPEEWTEAEINAEAERYRQQLLSEQEQARQASSANGSGAG